MEYEVAAVPTCIFYRSGKILDRVEGAKAADVSKMVRNLVSQKVIIPDFDSSKEPQKPEEPIEQKLSLAMSGQYQFKTSSAQFSQLMR